MIDTPWDPCSKEATFLRSMLTTDNQFQSWSDFCRWFDNQAAENHYEVERIPFTKSPDWYFADAPHRLVHRSGKFFAIEGLRVQTDFGPIPAWDQPIINQPEIGILGILTRVVDGVRYFLMQAKMEPGNINLVQLAPTVQATRSNYTRVHRGKTPRYLDYFVEPGRARVLIQQLQSEQGSRFLWKRNCNMIVEVEAEIPLYDEFRWLTLGEIKALLRRDNLVNMDSRTVLSCIPFANRDWRFYYMAWAEEPAHIDVFGHRLRGFPKRLFLSLLDRCYARHTIDEIISWFTRLKRQHYLSVETVALNRLRQWDVTEKGIHHESGRYFSVATFAVQAQDREVTCWTQPLLEHRGHGIVGFLAKSFNNVLHFLVRAVVEPGNRDMIEMGPTVAYSEPARYRDGEHPPFLDYFVDPEPDHVRYAAIQSEEGGRFYHFQNHYMILELPAEEELEIPETFIWMTLGQIVDLTRYSYFNIEARNLLSCLSLLEEAYE